MITLHAANYRAGSLQQLVLPRLGSLQVRQTRSFACSVVSNSAADVQCHLLHIASCACPCHNIITCAPNSWDNCRLVKVYLNHAVDCDHAVRNVGGQ